MFRSSLHQTRRRVGYGLLLAFSLAIAWSFSPGLPVLWGPWAWAGTREAGQVLFEHEWQPNDSLAGGDGLGPLFNARSCVACHFQGGAGGGGPNQNNVLTFETHPTTRDPQVRGGLVHASATDASLRESPALVRQLHPLIRGGTRVVDNCSVRLIDFDPVRLESINSTALFGAGWIDRISAKAIKQNHLRRGMDNIVKEFGWDFNTIQHGRPRVLADGRIGKFGWKAQFATLREFVAAACANELGLGNPLMEQARPLAKDGAASVTPDLDRRQFKSLVAFVDTLPRPVEVLPEVGSQEAHAVRGKALFGAVGCAACHTPDLGGVAGVYSDFLLHTLEDPNRLGSSYQQGQTPEVPWPDDHARPEEWKTPPLWGVADSAPYFHDGSSPTLEAAILRHGGDAATVRKAYKGLPKQDQDALVAFLQTLKAPPDAVPVKNASTQVVKRR